MANFVESKLQIIPQNETLGIVQYTIDRFVYYETTNLYFHYKTNIPKQSGIMFMLEAVGYSYGASQGVRCSWSGYTYSGSSTIINIGLHNAYPGLSAYSMYYSADNYVVFVGYGNAYCAGWTINGYTSNPSNTGFSILITASAAVATTTYY